MLAYALGIFAPLFVMAVAWDRMGWFRGLLAKEVPLFGKPRSIAHIIAGLLFIVTGGVFIFLRDTSFANTWDPLGTKSWWFQVQDVLATSPVALVAGALVLAAVVVLVIMTLRREPRIARE